MELRIFCYIMMAYGLTNIIVFGGGPFDLIKKTRNLFNGTTFGDMLNCPMCFSTNLGWIFSLFDIFVLKTINLTPFSNLIDDSMWYYIIILDAFFTSGCVWIIHTAQEFLESFVLKNERY